MATDDTTAQQNDLYPVIYRAVYDALWDVIGTAAYALFLVAVIVIGAWFALAFGLIASPGLSPFLLVTLFGATLAIAAAIQFLRLFDLFPFG